MAERTDNPMRPEGEGDDPAGVHPLEGLARKAEGATDLDVDEAQHGPAGGAVGPAVDLQRIVTGVERMLLTLLRAVRERIAVKMPEIRDEWTDEVLMGPAAAAIPLLQKYAQRLLMQLGENAELGAFAFSLFPLVMGYMAAQDKHARTIQAEPGGEA